MAATAQDSTAPLRSGEGKKDEDRDEESTCWCQQQLLPARVAVDFAAEYRVNTLIWAVYVLVAATVASGSRIPVQRTSDQSFCCACCAWYVCS